MGFIYWWRLVIILLAFQSAASAQDYEYETGSTAWFDWAMQCQGCHGATGANDKNGVPILRDHVAQFLSVEGGRAFLVQVPGVAGAPLSDARLAALMNWLLPRFDGANMPDDFVPYGAAEVNALRKVKRDVEIATIRRHLINKFDK